MFLIFSFAGFQSSQQSVILAKCTFIGEPRKAMSIFYSITYDMYTCPRRLCGLTAIVTKHSNEPCVDKAMIKLVI